MNLIRTINLGYLCIQACMHVCAYVNAYVRESEITVAKARVVSSRKGNNKLPWILHQSAITNTLTEVNAIKQKKKLY